MAEAHVAPDSSAGGEYLKAGRLGKAEIFNNPHLTADTQSEYDLILGHRQENLQKLQSDPNAVPPKPSKVFTHIIVTAANEGQAEDFRRELELRQRVIDGKNDVIPPETKILAVADPEGVRLGSGGATLEALRQLPEIKGRVLMLHSGGDSRRLPLCSVRGKAFCELPSTMSVGDDRTDARLKAPIDFLLQRFHQISASAPPGVFIASTDLMLRLPTASDYAYNWGPDFTGLGIPVDTVIGTRHGVFKADDDGNVLDFIQKGSEFTLNEQGFVNDGKVVVDSGVVFLSADIAEKLRSSDLPRMRRFELYTDIMLAMNKGLKYDDYMALPWESSGNTSDQIRQILWQILRPANFNVLIPPSSKCTFSHLGTIAEYLEAYTTNDHIFADLYNFSNRVACEVEESCTIDDESCIVNSLITGSSFVGKGSLVEHCRLTDGAKIEKGAVVSCIQNVPGIEVAAGVAIMEQQLGGRQYVLTLVGVNDHMKKPFLDKNASFLGVPWVEFLKKTGIKSRQIWPGVGQDAKKTLWNANLFPLMEIGQEPTFLKWMQNLDLVNEDAIEDWSCATRLSFGRCLQLCDPSSELLRRRGLWCKITMQKVIDILENNGTTDITHSIHQFMYDNPDMRNVIFSELEALRLRSSDNATVCQRTTNTIMLALKALLDISSSGESNDDDEVAVADGEVDIQTLTAKYTQWSNFGPMVRKCYKHYKHLHMELIRTHVLTAKYVMEKGSPMKTGEWVSMSCPARIDLAGGWSDTPPVCYTLDGGGMVVNAAVDVGLGNQGEQVKPPMTVRCARIEKPIISLKSGDIIVECETLKDMSDYRNPRAPLTLFKCSIIMLGIVDMSENAPELCEQLKDGGLEVECFCNLPQGSGLGTSSILAGCILRVIATAAGISFDDHTLMHLVLHVEQLLTTGGGWQDQVGGIYPGLKICTCGSGVPLDVNTVLLDYPQFVNELDKRLLLIFTGKRRIAKDILSRVVNRWSRRSDKVCNTVNSIVQNARDMVETIKKCDLEGFGKCLTLYDNQKDFITDGSRTPVDVLIRDKLRDMTLGMAICGAGGGGFMTVVMKDELNRELEKKVRKLLQEEIRDHGVRIWNAKINVNGLTIDKQGAS